jgi:hypothetical protein
LKSRYEYECSTVLDVDVDIENMFLALCRVATAEDLLDSEWHWVF